MAKILIVDDHPIVRDGLKQILGDTEDLVHKATGWMLRFAGDKDRPRLLKFLDQHAATMPRVALRYTIEKLDKKQRDHYLGLRKSSKE